jgi:hypothetical protein
MDNHATTNPDPSHELPERRRSARDLVLAGVAVGGDKQFAVDELQLVYREPAVAVTTQGGVLEHRQGEAPPTTSRAIILDRCGHYLAEEAPEKTLSVPTEFLAPYAAEDL